MTALMPLLAALEASALSERIGSSVMLTAGMSAMHALGFTLIMGGALLTNLRLVGALFRDRSLVEIVLPATRVMALGMLLSLSTGTLLFLPRAVAAAANPVFQLKMLLVVTAAITQFVFVARAVRGRRLTMPRELMAGVAGLVVWLALALTACAYILLE